MGTMGNGGSGAIGVGRFVGAVVGRVDCFGVIVVVIVGEDGGVWAVDTGLRHICLSWLVVAGEMLLAQPACRKKRLASCWLFPWWMM